MDDLKMADIVFNKLREVSFKIANLSANQDDEDPKIWWGMDTDIEDLQLDIQRELGEFYNWVINNYKNSLTDKDLIKDKMRLDFLQELTNGMLYTGHVIMRLSATNHGWRLHETSHKDAVDNVRVAIDNFMKKNINF